MNVQSEGQWSVTIYLTYTLYSENVYSKIDNFCVIFITLIQGKNIKIAYDVMTDKDSERCITRNFAPVIDPDEQFVLECHKELREAQAT